MTTKLRSVEEKIKEIVDFHGGDSHLFDDIMFQFNDVAAVLIEGLEGKKLGGHKDDEMRIYAGGHDDALDTAIALIKATLDVTSEEK